MAAGRIYRLDGAAFSVAVAGAPSSAGSELSFGVSDLDHLELSSGSEPDA